MKRKPSLESQKEETSDTQKSDGKKRKEGVEDTSETETDLEPEPEKKKAHVPQYTPLGEQVSYAKAVKRVNYVAP